MKRPLAWTLLAATAALSGCASVGPDEALSDARDWSSRSAAPPPLLALDDPTREQLRVERERLLDQPLTLSNALELALRGSPATQALLADGWRVQAGAAAVGGWPRVGLAFERASHGAEDIVTRTLAIGLTDLITLPARHALARDAVAAERLALAAEVLSRQQAVRVQWVRAVAAAQIAGYHADIREAASASAELARRMQAVGNFSRLQRAREQSLLADAVAAETRALAALAAEREALVRLLGLTPDEAARLQWPDRLPERPATPRSAAEVARAAAAERLDLRLAEARLQVAARQQGLAVPMLFGAGLAWHRESEGGETSRGTEIAVTLPAPDLVGLAAQGADAGVLAAAARLEQARIDAASTLRERHAAYRAAWALAQHHRDEIVPLARTIADESLLRYNGMLIGVFELLAEARGQVRAVMAALESERDFWLADAALDAAILGVPSAGTAPPPAASTAAKAETAGGH